MSNIKLNVMTAANRLAKAAAYILAPLMDKGRSPEVRGLAIVGGFNEYVNYGARIAVRV